MLAETMTVLALDLPGLGDSDAGGRPFDVPADVEALSGFLADLDAGPAFLAGQDWGGSIAFALAAAHPEAVRALAVIEAMPAGPWTDTDAASPWFVDFSQIPDLPERLVEGRERIYLDWLYRAFTATPGVPDEGAVDEYLRTYSRPGAMAAAFELYRSGRSRDRAQHAVRERADRRPDPRRRWRAGLRRGRRRQPAQRRRRPTDGGLRRLRALRQRGAPARARRAAVAVFAHGRLSRNRPTDAGLR